MTYEATAALGAALLAFAFAVSVVVDKRATAALVRRGDQAPRWVKRANRRWLAAWLVVWVLGIMLAKEDPDNREAGRRGGADDLGAGALGVLVPGLHPA